MTQLNMGPGRGTRATSSQAGFTLLEGLIVVVIVAIMAGLALPTWLGFLDQRRVNTAQYSVYQALRATQFEAAQKRQNQQFSLRERDGRVEWASHPETIPPAQAAQWTSLVEGVRLANEDNTLLRSGGVYYMRFDQWGNTRSRLGRVTLVGSGNRRTHRCVVVSTMLGAMRQGKGHDRPNRDGRYCY